MNKSLAFYGREKLLSRLRQLPTARARFIDGPAGIGKTAILRQLRQFCPFLHCEETSSLRRIADGLERPLEWTHRKLNDELLIEHSTGHYRIESFGLDLLALDRTIHELDTAIKAAVEQNT